MGSDREADQSQELSKFLGLVRPIPGFDAAEGGIPSLPTAPVQSRSGCATSRGFGHGRGVAAPTPPGIHPDTRSTTQDFRPIGLEAAPSFMRPGAPAWRGIGIGGGVPLPSRAEHRDFHTAPASRSIEAFGLTGRSSGATLIFRGRILDGRHFEDETARTGRFRCPEDYQRHREKRQWERIERGILIGVEVSIAVTDAYRFPFSEIEALSEILETRRQMFYHTPHPSCAFYVIAEEAYCCLRGFTRHLSDLP